MAAEVHLRASVIARAFDGQHLALAELVVKHGHAGLDVGATVGLGRLLAQALGVALVVEAG